MEAKLEFFGGIHISESIFLFLLCTGTVIAEFNIDTNAVAETIPT